MFVGGRKPCPRGQFDNVLAVHPEDCLRRDKECLDAFVKPGKSTREFLWRGYQNRKNVDPKLPHGGLGFRPSRLPDWICRVSKKRETFKVRNQFFEDLYPFCGHVGGRVCLSGNITTRASEASDQTAADRIGRRRHNDWN